MSTRLHIVMSDGLVAEIDRARGDVPRSVWIRRAVERALEAGRGEPGHPEISSTEPRVVGSLPAPAEQPEQSEGLRDLEARVDENARSMASGPIRDLVEGPRPFRPYPKGGKP